MRKLLMLVMLFLLPSHAAFGSVSDRPEARKLARFALVIGNNEPEDRRRATLKYADDDATAMHALLTEAGVRSRLLVSPDSDTAGLRPFRGASAPTPDAVFLTVDALFSEIRAAKKSGAKTELTFYYSGHGDVADGEGFVVLDGGRLTRSQLLERIVGQSPADTNHVIIDACKSYFMVFEKGPGGTRRTFRGTFTVAASGKNLDRTGFVLSASSDEESHEWERFQAGIFSYEVRSALRGGADVDRNGLVTYGELGAFVATANSGIANPSLRPNFLVSPPGRKPHNLGAPLLRWQDSAAGLIVDGAAAGHYFIETAKGVRIADIHSTRAEPLAVHLPSARPLFVRRASDLAEAVVTTAQLVTLSALSMQPASNTSKGALGLAFESLFSSPFGSEAVHAYDSLYAKKATESNLEDVTDANKPVRSVLLGVAGTTLAAGCTMTILGGAALSSAQDAAQPDVPSMNHKIESYNTAAISLYGVAAATGVSWLALKLVSIRKSRSPVTVFPIVSPSEISLGVSKSWGP